MVQGDQGWALHAPPRMGKMVGRRWTTCYTHRLLYYKTLCDSKPVLTVFQGAHGGLDSALPSPAHHAADNDGGVARAGDFHGIAIMGGINRGPDRCPS